MDKRKLYLLCLSLNLSMVKASEPQLTEEMVRVIDAKDKCVTVVELAERNYLTPKEYGIKKLGKRKI
jgi:hypothetical protein